MRSSCATTVIQFFATFLVCFISLPLAAQTSETPNNVPQSSPPTATPLPAQAEAALQKGLTAAQEQAWPLAVQSFFEAWQAAPSAPVVLFNLGLAESKIPKHEMRALVWFKA